MITNWILKVATEWRQVADVEWLKNVGICSHSLLKTLVNLSLWLIIGLIKLILSEHRQIIIK